MKRILSAVTLMLLALPRLEASPEPRTYPCYRLREAPVVDGNLDKAVWKTLPEATGFYLLDREGFAGRKPTSFRMSWSADALYLAVRCREPFTSWLKALPDDGDPLWTDDSIEVFLAPAGTDSVQLIANTVGARWNGRNGAAAPKMWDWQVKAKVSGDEWTMEARVPFAIVGRTPKEGDAWRFNIARNVTTGPANERFSSWSPVKRGFDEVAAFATLAFKGAPAPGEVAAAQSQLSADFRAFIRRKPAGPANLVVNGSFEDGMSDWDLRGAGKVSIDETTATEGVRSIRLDASNGADYVAAVQNLNLKPGTNYLIRCDIKRSQFSSGIVSVDVIERDRKDVEWTYHRCGNHPDKADRPNAWGHYELRFRTSNHLLEAKVMIENNNSGAVAWYDNIKLVEADGLGEASGRPSVSTTLRFELEARDASAKLLVNGTAVEAKPGQPLSARICDGGSVVGVEARAQGPNPGVRVRLIGHPETDGRWRVATQPDAGWMTCDFDDGQWPVVADAPGGFVWVGDRTAPQAILRQVLLWNQGHDGPDRCINPLIREWGISEGSMETLFLSLYSPFSFPLEDYEFLLDVPAEFRLLDIMHDSGGRKNLNLRPSKLTTMQVTHDGRPYTRYRIAYPNSVPRDQMGGLLLPIFLEKWSDKEKTTAWYYRRLAKGNFTELQQRIPVRVLPPINGRLPKRIQISQYCAVPWARQIGVELTPAHLDQHMRQSFQAGFNTWILADIEMDDYVKTVHDRILELGGRIILWANYPYGGLKVPVASADLQAGYKWLQENPQARARYFEDSDTWEKRGQYCPTYVLGEGRAGFMAAVKKNYQARLANMPGASVIWADWEEFPWISGGPDGAARDGKGSWCFCDRCKAEFRKWANLPANADLSDENIFKNYKKLWNSFRTELDARLAGLNRQISNELGKPYMVYSWNAYRKYWEDMKGRIDLAFTGCPGNAPADSYQQKALDDAMRFFRDRVGLDRSKVMGQRFSFYAPMFFEEQRDLGKSWPVLSPSAYVEPKTWKSQVLRVVASFGNGIDLQSSLECSGGMLYWIGEATRILATYEDLFHEGERDDALASCDKWEYPNILVLKRGDERLVLLFNEGDKPVAVTLRNKDVKPGQTATVYEAGDRIENAAEMRLTIPEGDVAVVQIQ